MTEAVIDAVDNEVVQQATDDAAAVASAAAGAVKDEDKSAEGEQPKAGEAEANDEVVYDFKVPEGFEVGPEADALKTLAKEHKLPAAAVQQLVDLAVQREQAKTSAHAAQVKAWSDEVEADKELGGANSKDTKAFAARALALAPPGVVEMLDASGLGNFPPLVRWARDIGKALSEDNVVAANEGGAAVTKSIAERLYGKTSN